MNFEEYYIGEDVYLALKKDDSSFWRAVLMRNNYPSDNQVRNNLIFILLPSGLKANIRKYCLYI